MTLCAEVAAHEVRQTFGPPMEYLIDDLLCPRGFWSIDSTVKAWSSEYRLDRVDSAD